MNVLKPHHLEEIIVCLLLGGENTIQSLRQESERYKKSTKQGFYAALRKLKKEEVVTTYKKSVALNTTWLQEMRSTFDEAFHRYTGSNTSLDVLSLEDGEGVS